MQMNAVFKQSVGSVLGPKQTSHQCIKQLKLSKRILKALLRVAGLQVAGLPGNPNH